MKNENNAIAYLKMHKNPVTPLKTEDDFVRWAKKCLTEADAYYAISFRCIDMIFTDNSNAVLTNVSFACELYLKHLLLSQKINYKSEHSLDKLFNKLPSEMQESLKQLHPCTNTSIDMFERELTDVAKAFTIFRYMYERGNIAYNLQFLMELLFTLHTFTHDHINEFKNPTSEK